MRASHLLLAVLLAAGASWMLLGGDAAGSISPSPATAATKEPAPAADRRIAPSPTDDRLGRRVVSPPPLEADEPDPIENGLERLLGTVIAVDPKGEEHPSEDGTLALTTWQGGLSRSYKVAVRAGRFTVDVLKWTTEISFDNVVLGSRIAKPTEDRVPLAQSIEIRATWHPPTILRVVDAEYRFDLSDITVVAAMSNAWRQDLIHPGGFPASAQRVTGGRSPLELAPDAESEDVANWQEMLWVHSPGYAWARVTVDYENPADRLVELGRGGTLEVSIEGRLPPTKPSGLEFGYEDDTPLVRLRRTSERPDIEKLVEDALAQFAAQPIAGPGVHVPTAAELRTTYAEKFPRQPGTLVFEAHAMLGAPVVLSGLLAGRYEVTVECGHGGDSPLVLGSSDAKIVAGSTTRITLRVDSPPERQTVPLAGTLLLPPAWDFSLAPCLVFYPIDVVGTTVDLAREIHLAEMRADATIPGLFHWDAGLVVPTRYEVTCSSLDYKRWVVDTGTNGNRNADIVVGEPVDMAVELLDDATGRPIDDAEVLAEGNARGWVGSAWNAKTKRYEFRVPAGTVEVYVGGWYSTVGDATFDVSPNQREFVVRARRDFGIDLILVSGAARIPWADETRSLVSVERLGKPAAVSGTGVGPDSALRLALREPGTYEVTIPDQPGFEPVLPFEVDVRTGEFTRHEARLLPKR